jgi:hypothetical protein
MRARTNRVYHLTVVMLRRVSALLLLCALPAVAFAQKPATADRVRSAADEYDAGRRAFNDSKFDEAAVHFENAFRDAPAAAAIRNAITARAKAGHSARAATEAALALTKYPDDAATRDLSKATLSELEPKLHKTILNCSPECGVVADSRAVSIEDAARVVFYLDPGDHELVVSWGEDRTKIVKVSAKAGGKSDYSLEAPPPKPKPPPDTGGGTGAVGNNPPPTTGEQPSRKPFGPVVFVIGTVLTVAGGVALAVSGVDTLNNPGTDKVKMACVGKGEQCPEYQQGLQAQTRTNVILGATIGVGVLTAVVGIFFTQWSSPSKEAKIRPLLEIGSTSQVGLQGSF